MSATHNPRAYLRTSPPHVRKAIARASRPAPLSKSQGVPKASLKGNKAKTLGREEDTVVDEEDDMGSSFLQYCAMCEKQIVVPNNSILYCSENCRRKDGCQAPASSPYLPLFSPSLNHYISGEDCEDILGLKARNASARQQSADSLLSPRIPPLTHEGKSDLDPSEWKPNLSPRSSSEAFQYLSQFHRSSASLAPSRRPTLPTRRTTASVAITTPSLSHTPTTSTSSDESLAGTPYEFATRPLLPRHDPTYSASAGTKSVDLVIPHLPSAFSVPVSGIAVDTKLSSTAKKCDLESTTITGDANFGKRWVVGSPGPAAGSLKKLLEIGIQGVPRIDL
ncbi:hypothetical protein MMC07_009250 [Pseudocyphellaria aurata]|nr:hypothetical protein [Pseudocyphellaria aurata]